MRDYYCPYCEAELGDQPGFDPAAGYWTCTECGQFLTNPEDSDVNARFPEVDWFCDVCGTFLNNQIGFSDWYSTWTCTKCGHVNNISEEEIYDSEEAYQKSCSDNSNDEGDDDGFGYGDEWQYGNPRRCEGCGRLLNKQSGFYEYFNTHICEKCGYYNDWSDEDLSDGDDDEDIGLSYYESDEDDDEEEDNGAYFDFEEYEQRMMALMLQKELEEKQQQEKKRRKEEERRQKTEQRKARHKKIWRTLTGKKQTVGFSSDQSKTMGYKEVVRLLERQEFYNISTNIIEDLTIEEKSREGIVEAVGFNGIYIFETDAQFPYTSQIEVTYHMLRRKSPPLTSREAKKKDIGDVVWEFTNAGFVNIDKIAIPDLKKGWLVKEDSVDSLTINGKKDFRKTDKIRIDAQIAISYHTFKDKK
ncbi:MAG: hypothetical protein J1F41_03465 [Lachnospiraceae bacterium]|nr:hypothetical protein [Lachnospiraceae bacterium]